MTILCLCPQFAGPVGCFREEVRFPAGGCWSSEVILFPCRILLKPACAAMEWRLQGLSHLLVLWPCPAVG